MVNNQLQEFHEVAKQVHAQSGAGMVEKAVNSLIEEKKALEKELAKLKLKLASGQGVDLASQAVTVKGAKVLAATRRGRRRQDAARDARPARRTASSRRRSCSAP